MNDHIINVKDYPSLTEEEIKLVKENNKMIEGSKESKGLKLNKRKIKREIEEIGHDFSLEVYKKAIEETKKLTFDRNEVREEIITQTIIASIGDVFYMHRKSEYEEFKNIKNTLLKRFSKEIDQIIKRNIGE